MTYMDQLFTTGEAAALADATPGAVEKAIEEGIVEVRKAPAAKGSARPRRLLSVAGVYYIAFLKNCAFRFSKEHKHKLWSCLKTTPPERLLKTRWHFSPGVEVNPGELLRPVAERVKRYARARDRWIGANPEIKGGTPVIKGTRMTVYSVAGRVKRGDTIEAIMEENPDLPRKPSRPPRPTRAPTRLSAGRADGRGAPELA